MMEAEIKCVLVEFSGKYPPILTFDQAAEIAQAPKATLYDWSSRGLLNGFKTKRGKRVGLIRDPFVRFLLRPDSQDDAA